MPAKAEPFAAGAHRTQLRPSSDKGILSVRAHEPGVWKLHVSDSHLARIDFCNARAPMKNDASLDSALNQKLMQPDPPQSESRRIREFCVRGTFGAGKPDSSEGDGEIRIYMDSERAQRGNSFWQQPLSARLIDRRSPGVENDGSKSSLICRDRSRDPRRPCSNNDDVGV